MNRVRWESKEKKHYKFQINHCEKKNRRRLNFQFISKFNDIDIKKYWILKNFSKKNELCPFVVFVFIFWIFRNSIITRSKGPILRKSGSHYHHQPPAFFSSWFLITTTSTNHHMVFSLLSLVVKLFLLW